MAMDIYINMTPKEKYINYIADDLYSKTEVENAYKYGYKIILPFSSIYSYDSILPMNLRRRRQFINYIIQKYGAREEDYKPIWERYRRLVNNNLIKK